MVLPKGWSIKKIQAFKASTYMIQTVKKLVAEKGILSSQNVKPGKVSDASCYSWNGEAISCIWWQKQNQARDKEIMFLLSQKTRRSILWPYLSFKEQNPDMNNPDKAARHRKLELYKPIDSYANFAIHLKILFGWSYYALRVEVIFRPYIPMKCEHFVLSYYGRIDDRREEKWNIRIEDI